MDGCSLLMLSMTRTAFPVFVMVMTESTPRPTRIVPKLTLLLLTVIVYEAPNPVTTIVSGDAGSLLMMTKCPEVSPGATGVNRRVSVTEAMEGAAKLLVLALKVLLLLVMERTVTGSSPSFVRTRMAFVD